MQAQGKTKIIQTLRQFGNSYFQDKCSGFRKNQDSTVVCPLAPCNYNWTEQIMFDHQ